MGKHTEEIGWVVALVAFLAFLLWGATIDSHDNEQKRQDKRYEQCLDKGMQWVDNGCVAK